MPKTTTPATHTANNGRVLFLPDGYTVHKVADLPGGPVYEVQLDETTACNGSLEACEKAVLHHWFKRQGLRELTDAVRDADLMLRQLAETMQHVEYLAKTKLTSTQLILESTRPYRAF